MQFDEHIDPPVHQVAFYKVTALDPEEEEEIAIIAVMLTAQS